MSGGEELYPLAVIMLMKYYILLILSHRIHISQAKSSADLIVKLERKYQ